MLPTTVLAQDIPSSADPARLIPNQGVIQRSYESSPVLNLKATVPELSPEIASKTFILKNVRVNGMIAFSQKEAEKTYNQFIGKTITVADLFDIMRSLQQLYIDEGYNFSKVSLPEQSVEGGDILFTVYEGYVAEVEIDESIADIGIVKDFSRYVQEMMPLNTQKLERMMLLLNDRPGLSVVSVLSEPLKPHPIAGAMRLILKNNADIEQERLISGSVSFDTYGSNYIGPGQISGDISVNNIANTTSNLSLNAKVATSIQELQQMGVNYDLPLFGISGANLSVGGNLSRSEPGSTIDILDVKGKSENIFLNLTYPILRQRSQNVIVGGKIAYTNSKTRLLGEEVARDRIRSASVSMSYSGSDKFRGLNLIQLSLSHGLDILNSSKSGDLNLSRSDGRSDFKKMVVAASRLQPLSNRVDAYLGLQGQYTKDPLLSSEEFGFGGAEMGRGYDPSEITGDKGLSATVELRYNTVAPKYDLTMQHFIFYDIGKFWNIDTGASNRLSAASAGFGTRVNYKGDLSLSAMLAFPLTKQPESSPSYSGDNDMRFLFGVTKRF